MRIQGEHRTSGEALSFVADRVYLAAGVFNTTAILLASLDAYDVPGTGSGQPTVPRADAPLCRECPRWPRSRSTPCPRYSSN